MGKTDFSSIIVLVILVSVSFFLLSQRADQYNQLRSGGFSFFASRDQLVVQHDLVRDNLYTLTVENGPRPSVLSHVTACVGEVFKQLIWPGHRQVEVAGPTQFFEFIPQEDSFMVRPFPFQNAAFPSTTQLILTFNPEESLNLDGTTLIPYETAVIQGQHTFSFTNNAITDTLYVQTLPQHLVRVDWESRTMTFSSRDQSQQFSSPLFTVQPLYEN